MANTYTQIYIQAVFAVEGRQSLIVPEHKIEIYKYMTTLIQNQKHKVMAINGMPDHVHLLIGLNPDIALSALVRDVKAASSRLINDNRWVKGHFNWQRGYGAFFVFEVSGVKGCQVYRRPGATSFNALVSR